jgi:hypothetical protein
MSRKRTMSLVGMLTATAMVGLSSVSAGDGTATSPDRSKMVKVFILAGQSNMVGHGKVEDGLNPQYDPKDKSKPRAEPQVHHWPVLPGGLRGDQAAVGGRLLRGARRVSAANSSMIARPPFLWLPNCSPWPA